MSVYSFYSYIIQMYKEIKKLLKNFQLYSKLIFKKIWCIHTTYFPFSLEYLNVVYIPICFPLSPSLIIFWFYTFLPYANKQNWYSPVLCKEYDPFKLFSNSLDFLFILFRIKNICVLFTFSQSYLNQSHLSYYIRRFSF